jgi:hypothetical protein
VCLGGFLLLTPFEQGSLDCRPGHADRVQNQSVHAELLEVDDSKVGKVSRTNDEVSFVNPLTVLKIR